MRELYLDDIPLGSSNENNYENFISREKLGRMLGGGRKKGMPLQENIITPDINNDDDNCEQQWKQYSSTMRFRSQLQMAMARKSFMQKCRSKRSGLMQAIQEAKPVYGIPRPFQTAEITVSEQEIPVYQPIQQEQPSVLAYDDIKNKMREIPVVERRNSLGGITREPLFKRIGRKVNLGLSGIFGGIFKKRVKRHPSELKQISIRAKEIWEKDNESWSEALKRAEKQLVKEGNVTPATYLNFDSQGNAVGYEHETYNDYGDDYMEETEDYNGFCGNCG